MVDKSSLSSVSSITIFQHWKVCIIKKAPSLYKETGLLHLKGTHIRDKTDQDVGLLLLYQRERGHLECHHHNNLH